MPTDRPPLRLGSVEKPPPAVGAADHLLYIRAMMERGGSFTAVPGWGAFAVGLTAVAAAWFASRQRSEAAWLLVWLGEATVAVLLGGGMLVRKARASGVALDSGPARKYFLSLIPPLVAGALLTLVLWRAEQPALLHGMWLLLYGTGTVTGGVYSVPVVPMMGLAFMALGGLALLTPPVLADAFMAAGFGGLHLLFGWIIARNYGG